MPTPFDIFFNTFLNPVAYTCMAIFAALIAWEQLFPARRLARVPYWPLRGLAAFVCYFLLSSYLPLWWDATLVEYRLLDTSTLPVWAQVVAGILLYELFVYWWHRALHSIDALWRIFHQMHHSAERLDTFGAFWFSPTDMAGFTLMSSLALTLVLGVSVDAAVLILYATLFLGIFQHANIRTPLWLGYFVQRPESHSRHHGKGVHRDNYADLPLFDLLFGTFHNPVSHRDNGFYHGASSRVGAMLLWRDINVEVVLDPEIEMVSKS
jgi:sterol desaturase/sphingolipid hydroxylase (fatty acid hydroxylase superfamily)